MAKASQRSRRRTKANARRRVRGTAGISNESLKTQDEMFFMRLRNHAKWVFVALSVVFVFSFVVAGVGSGSTGVGDLFGSVSLFGGGSSSSNPVKAAQKQVAKAGRDTAKLAPALSALANAQALKGLTADAESSYRRYLALRPTDANAHHELSLLYSSDAQTQALQLDSIESDVVQSAPIGSKLVTDPIQAAVHQDALSHATDFYNAYRTAKQQELTELAAATANAKGAARAQFQDQEGPEAYNAAGIAANFGARVPESPAAASAQTDVQTWAALAIPALKAALVRHKHDSLATQISQMISQLAPYAPAPAKSSGR